MNGFGSLRVRSCSLPVLGALLAVVAGSASGVSAADTDGTSTTWRWRLPQPTGVTLRAACVDASKVLWVAGDAGLLGRFVPDGSLERLPLATEGTLRAIACCNDGVAAVTDAGVVVWRGRDGELRETRLGTADAPPSPTAVVCGSGGGLVVADTAGGIWRAGADLAFTRGAAPHPVFGLHVAGDALLAAGPRGAIARTSDGGRSWLAVGLPPGSDEAPTGHVLALAGDGRHVVAVGRGGLHARSTDHGKTFTLARSGTTLDLTAVVWGGSREVHALAGGTRVQWLSAPQREPAVLDAQYHGLVWHAGTVRAVGTHGRVALREAGGTTWQVSRRPDWRLFGAWTDGRVEILVGERGLIQRREGGGPLRPVPSPVKGAIHDVKGNGTGLILAVGELGGVARSSDAGRTWQWVELDAKYGLVSVWLDRLGHAVAVGQGGLRFVSRDGGLSWKAVQPLGKDQELTGVVADGRRLWVTGANGFLERSDDYGKSWYSAAAPTAGTDLRTPCVSERGTLLATSFNGAIHRRSRDGRWTSATLSPGSRPSALVETRGELIAVTTDGKVFVSRDDGVNFSPERGPGRVLFNSLTVAPDGRVWATGLEGMWLVRDAPVAPPSRRPARAHP